MDRDKLEDILFERVIKGDFRKVYSLEEIWRWIMWGLKKGIIKKSKDKDNIENIMKWIDLLGRSRFVVFHIDKWGVWVYKVGKKI